MTCARSYAWFLNFLDCFLQCLTQTQQTLAVNFAFDIAKVSLVVALYFFTDCLKIIGKKVQISKALIFFSKPIRKTDIVRS